MRAYPTLQWIHSAVLIRRIFAWFSGVGTTGSAIGDDGVLNIDVTISLETTWHGMEDLVSAGLVKSIGIRFQFQSLFFAGLILGVFIVFIFL